MSVSRGVSFIAMMATCFAVSCQAATIPVSVDFDDNTAPGFSSTAGTNAVWSTTGGARQLKFTNSPSGDPSISSSLVQVTTDVAALGAFVFETDIRVSSYTSTPTNGILPGNGIDIGVVAFSNAATSDRYLFDFNPSKHTVRLTGFDSDPIPQNFSFSTADTYHLSIVGTYASGTLHVVASFIDPTGATLVFNASDSTPRSGAGLQGWGYRARTGSGTGTSNNATIHFDNFSLVPEPSSGLFSLGCVGLATLLIRRRQVGV